MKHPVVVQVVDAGENLVGDALLRDLRRTRGHTDRGAVEVQETLGVNKMGPMLVRVAMQMGLSAVCIYLRVKEIIISKNDKET